MALTSSDLLGGGAPAAELRVEYKRAVLIKGERREAGSAESLPKALAMQLVGAGQAVLVAEPDAPKEPTAHSASRAVPKG